MTGSADTSPFQEFLLQAHIFTAGTTLETQF